MRTPICLAVALLVATSSLATAEPVTVAITAIVEHPALNAVRDGVKEGLVKAGHKEGETVRFVYESAQGQPATAAQIARQLVGQRPAIIVPISTPSSQAVVAATRDIPVVFTAVTDPVGAQLVRSTEKPGGNVTGLSDLSPVADQLKLIREITPNVKRLGVIYNPGEANSVTLVRLLKDLAGNAGIEVQEAPANKSADAQAAARSLIGKVDAVYVPTDNTVVSALESVVGVTQDAKLPLYAGDTDSVGRGALASVGFDYHDVGLQTATLVDRVLKGEKPGEIPVQFATGTDLFINKSAAQKIGLVIPEAVLKRATKVVE
jgi:putative tryptophan/tyrosine transport system substrate-binding protein